MTKMSTAQNRRGFASIIGLLMVLVIIMILLQEGYFKKGQDGETDASRPIRKSESVACIQNLKVMNDEIAQSMALKGSAPINAVRVKFQHMSCPHTGKYVIQVHGKVYCEEHQPPPVGMLVEDFHVQ